MQSVECLGSLCIALNTTHRIICVHQSDNTDFDDVQQCYPLLVIEINTGT